MTDAQTTVASWLRVTQGGLYCEPGGFFVDPGRAVSRAVVTHGHGDHARPGHGHVLATPETCAIMAARMGRHACGNMQELTTGAPLRIGDVTLTLVPAGHVLGSAQVVIEYGGHRAVVSGDYKRRGDPTCAAFELVTCDVFITEATFGLPVFRHPPAKGEIDRLLASLQRFPERCHMVGVYALGKAQRVIALLRQAGYDEPLYIHASLTKLCELYETLGVVLGPLLPITDVPGDSLAGRIVLAPPSAASDRWSRRLPALLPVGASGWMGVRARARQRGVELALVLSDHADWDELIQTMHDVEAAEIWVTHGREEALVHYATTHGLNARALSLRGREEDV
ncbi:MAG: ligase-associated DNA damage response exonuclease [Alphaproteobacteria bacterium]